MDVKEAVKRAKTYVADLFAEESLVDLGLEEIEHDEAAGTWNVTLGFSRPWNSRSNSPSEALATLSILQNLNALNNRAYKVVKVQESSGEIISVRNRDL